MNTLVANIFFVLLYLCILVNRISAGDIGDSSCRYSAGYENDDKRCHSNLLEINDLPTACTSFVFDGITCGSNLEIGPSHSAMDFDVISKLVENKPNNVFVFYEREDKYSWYDAIFASDPLPEAQKVKEFVTKYRVSGLILSGIECKNDDDTFYTKFLAYVSALKAQSPSLKIGLYLRAVDMLRHMNDSTWFDFDQINDVMDFYVIEFVSFNPCTTELLHTGITPLQQTTPSVNTLTAFAAALEASKIARDKVYFELLISPQPMNVDKASHLTCEYSYNEYCENENDYDPIWCVDNQDTLFDKGQFAKKYSNGFIASSIDLVDRDKKCGCNDDRFMTFHMLLNGYNGADKITCEIV